MADAHGGVLIRRARPGDAAAVARLVYSTASGMYDLLLRDRERALRFIASNLPGPGNDSKEVVWVAERGGQVAGTLLGFRADDASALARRFGRQVLLQSPPWRWPGIVRLLWLGERHAPQPAPGSFYVDALASGPEHRRRGVASALLAQAEAHACSYGMSLLSVDTPESNEGGLALYSSAGFKVAAQIDIHPPLPRAVALVKRLD